MTPRGWLVILCLSALLPCSLWACKRTRSDETGGNPGRCSKQRCIGSGVGGADQLAELLPHVPPELWGSIISNLDMASLWNLYYTAKSFRDILDTQMKSALFSPEGLTSFLLHTSLPINLDHLKLNTLIRGVLEDPETLGSGRLRDVNREELVAKLAEVFYQLSHRTNKLDVAVYFMDMIKGLMRCTVYMLSRMPLDPMGRFLNFGLPCFQWHCVRDRRIKAAQGWIWCPSTPDEDVFARFELQHILITMFSGNQCFAPYIFGKYIFPLWRDPAFCLPPRIKALFKEYGTYMSPGLSSFITLIRTAEALVRYDESERQLRIWNVGSGWQIVNSYTVTCMRDFFSNLGFDWDLINYLDDGDIYSLEKAWKYSPQALAEIALMMGFDIIKILESYLKISDEKDIAADGDAEDYIKDHSSLLPVEPSFEAAVSIITGGNRPRT